MCHCLLVCVRWTLDIVVGLEHYPEIHLSLLDAEDKQQLRTFLGTICPQYRILEDRFFFILYNNSWYQTCQINGKRPGTQLKKHHCFCDWLSYVFDQHLDTFAVKPKCWSGIRFFFSSQLPLGHKVCCILPPWYNLCATTTREKPANYYPHVVVSVVVHI